MSNIREYLRKKETSEKKDFKKEIVRHRLTLFYRVLLGIGVAAAIAAILFIQAKNKIYQTNQVIAEIDKKIAASAEEIELGTHILTYSKDGANCMDLKGNVIWNQTYEMQNPLVDTNGNTVGIADYNGHTIYLMNTMNILGEIDTGMPIRSFRVSDNGMVAAVLDDSSVTWVSLYDSKGTKMSDVKCTMKISGYPIDIALSSDAVLLAVSYLYVDSGEIKTKIAFYNFGAVGQNKVERLVGAYEYSDSVVPVIEFMNNSTIFALADNRLMIYKGDKIPVHQAEGILSDEIQGVFYSEKYIGLLYLNTGGEDKYRLDIYNDVCKLLKSITFDMQFKDIIIRDERVIIYNEAECAIYTVDGIKKYEGPFRNSVNTFIPTEKQDKYIGITEDKIQTIELR